MKHKTVVWSRVNNTSAKSAFCWVPPSHYSSPSVRGNKSIGRVIHWLASQKGQTRDPDRWFRRLKCFRSKCFPAKPMSTKSLIRLAEESIKLSSMSQSHSQRPRTLGAAVPEVVGFHRHKTRLFSQRAALPICPAAIAKFISSLTFCYIQYGHTMRQNPLFTRFYFCDGQ